MSSSLGPRADDHAQAFQVDLTNCDREPIHIPGAIQPHGVLFALSEPDLVVEQVSSNVGHFLGQLAPEQVVGQAASTLFDERSVQALFVASASPEPRAQSPLLLRAHEALGGACFDGIVHRSDGVLLLELEPAARPGERSYADVYRRVRESIASLQGASRVLDLSQVMTREVANLTGFDRVMVYRFDADGHGHVIAETKRDHLEPYLDLHYPASDIPSQARRLYLINLLRLIPDIGYQPAALVPALHPRSEAPLDLSLAVLRSVSAIHVEYLRNMGVTATMAISLVVDGKLWGLVICHHYAPLFVRYEVRAACELLGQVLSWHVASRERADDFERRAGYQVLVSRLSERLGQPALLSALADEPALLLSLTESTGAAVRMQGRWYTAGQVPARAALDELARTVLEAQSDVLVSDAVRALRPDLEPMDDVASGLVGFTASPERGDVVLWLRPEIVRTVNWAGAPQKVQLKEGDNARLSPRGSFALWSETVSGRSLPFTDAQVDAARDLRRTVVERERNRLADIETMRVQAEEQRARLRAIFEHAPVAVSVLVGPGQIFEVANPAYERLVGRTGIVGKSFRAAFPELPGDAPVFAMVDGLFATGEPYASDDYEVAIQNAEGRIETTHFLFSCQPVRGANGDVDMVITVAVDVTPQVVARRQLEHARAEAARGEAQFRALAESMPQMVWRTRPDGFHEFYNQRWYDYTGLPHDRSEGGGWADPLHPDDRERSRGRWEHSLRTGDPYEIEYRFRRHDGVYRWFLGRALPTLDAAGNIVMWFGTCTDIDDKKRAEEGLRVLAETGTALAAPLNVRSTLYSVAQLVVPALADWSSIFLVDDAGNLTLAAAAHADPSKELLLHDMAHAYLGGRAERNYTREVIHGGRTDRLVQFDEATLARIASGPEHRRLLEQLAPISAITVPLGSGGRTFGTISFVSSDSGRRYGEEDLHLAEEIGRRVAVALDSANMFELSQRERRRAEEANRAKDEFLGVASHELRTPLNAILGWARMLRTGSLDERGHARALETIERNAKIQVQLIEDILDVSRIITGKLRLSVSPVDVMQVIEAAADVVKHAADAKGVRIQLLLDPSAGLVHGDPERLQQVIWNLLSNAVKFSDKQGRVHVRLSREESHVEIAVADKGRGIDPAFLPHVFEPFRQADASSTRSFGGLGLGLAIVKHLVELHGGTIEAHSDGKGSGATFTVRIPIAPVRPSTMPAAENASRAEGSGRMSVPPELSGLKVLVVDDQPDARELLQSILSQGDVTVHLAPSADDALRMLQSERPDLLISDIGMPEADGYSLIAAVRALPVEQGGATPAIALTAYSRIEDRTKALLEGFTNHITKPVDPQELFAVIAAATGRRRTPDPQSRG